MPQIVLIFYSKYFIYDFFKLLSVNNIQIIQRRYQYHLNNIFKIISYIALYCIQ